MINVALLGMGNIGLLYDYNKQDTNRAYSHAKAIYLHKEFDLKYVVDPSDKNIGLLKDLFPNVKYLNSYELLDTSNIDILVIAAPTNLHFEILNYFKNSNIKLFLVEKPLFYNKNEYENLDNFFKDKLVVNYMRRFQEPLIKLREEIRNDKFGLINKIILNYVKGLKNNGSHFIDLINFLFDSPEIISSSILDSSLGFSEEDLTYDIFIKIKYKNKIVPIHFISHDHTKYNIIEFKLYFEKQVIEYINSKQKISYFNINESIEYKGYNFIDENASYENNISKRLIYNVYEELYLHLKKNKTITSSYKDELSNFKFIEKILENK
ncbi:Gfo/Idh/MocA family protein [Poseidonibacter lekithochrous]|uniref:Gfo/Idh/MocA family protein n=1 Tax=Poseidonibacter lekithochrous TaxID=1904463 RepID=UPI000D335812|nr:Gfo/Idh/MocA family oxidoreductase [Poseidonibacter lekithochrous]